ncbi:NADPH-dependent curcumin reductase CurA [Hydrogenophaga palleronii]|uniref:NADPH-dependent curcumin reductase CurA n=1 Tax=Hydrogenophaga palleronii TaxID=65655 RepID=A0ABU1WTQ0_9BURK|nr:NADP-dependent oxidoreductase [Hydrogenophaga palleronii]MDR7152534.1 NADPH-dependent curcumin reductase CurA [Hydrogenophaga palleronii]
MTSTSLGAQSATVNRRIVLASRPDGAPSPSNFRTETTPVPAPMDGQVLLQTLVLSLDPYMRNLMDPMGPGYAPPVEVGAPMVGGTVSRVVASRHTGFRPGNLVLANAGWQDYTLSDGSDLLPLDEDPQPSLALGALGMPGFTAHVGLIDIAQVRRGDTVVVAAATGAVGAVVGQLARLHGARVVGIAGGAEKCRHALEVLRFDVCIDRHALDFARQLAQACAQGIDVYFENVGGAVLDAVLPLLNTGARVPVCGFIAHYNDAAGAAQTPDLRPALLATVLQKRVHLQGFIVLDHYGERFEHLLRFRTQMRHWIEKGHVRVQENVVHGLLEAPQGFIDLLSGHHLGKTVVRVAEA